MCDAKPNFAIRISTILEPMTYLQAISPIRLGPNILVSGSKQLKYRDSTAFCTVAQTRVRIRMNEPRPSAVATGDKANSGSGGMNRCLPGMNRCLPVMNSVAQRDMRRAKVGLSASTKAVRKPKRQNSMKAIPTRAACTPRIPNATASAINVRFQARLVCFGCNPASSPICGT